MARPKTMASRKLVSLPPDLTEAVENYRFENRIRSESEAIRRLIERGLETAKAPPARPAKAKPRTPPK
jgi:metal-responsive CopG/Arc/MetJ family transcriptional regulator